MDRYVVDKSYAGGKPASPDNFLGYAVIDRERGRIEGVYLTAAEAYRAIETVAMRER